MKICIFNIINDFLIGLVQGSSVWCCIHQLNHNNSFAAKILPQTQPSCNMPYYHASCHHATILWQPSSQLLIYYDKDEWRLVASMGVCTSRDLISWSSLALSCCLRCFSALILCLSSCCHQATTTTTTN